MTWAWMDTSSAETGSSHTINLGFSASARADADALALPSGEFVRVASAIKGLHSDGLEQMRHPLRDLLAVGDPWMSSGSPMISPTVMRG